MGMRERLMGSRRRSRRRGGKGDRRWKRPGHAAAALGLDPVCTVVPDDVFLASLWAARSPVPLLKFLPH